MDVRCERCRTEYEFDDDKITEAGVTVRCTVCGHVFKVKKKALVVTVPLKPGETAGAPDLPPPSPEKPREWKVRQANGNVFTFKELTTLQKWIVERKVVRDDEISLTGESWKRLGNIAELASFFQVVEAADRANTLAALAQQQAAGPAPLQPSPVAQSAPEPQAAPELEPPPIPAQAPAEERPEAPPSAPRAGTAAWEGDKPSVATVDVRDPAWSNDGDDLTDELAAIKGGGKGKYVLVALLLVAAGAGGFFYAKQAGLLGDTEQAAAETTKQAGNATPQEAPPPAEPAEPTAIAQAAVDAGEIPDTDAGPPPEQAKVDEPKADESKPPPEEPEAEQKKAVAEEPKRPEVKHAKAEGGIPDGKSFYWYIERAFRQRERGRVDSALAYYEKAEALEPDNFEVFSGKGYCQFDKGRYDAAIAIFQKALGKNPRFLDAILGLAESYKEKGNKSKAIEYYRKYLDEAPAGTPEANLARASIERLSKQ